MNTENHSQTAAFLWSIADLLRGDFKQSQYGRIILPFTLLRRMECVLEPTKEAVIRESYAQEGRPDLVRERLLLRAAGQQFFNASKLTLGTLSDTQTAADLMSYVQSFSKDAREIFEHFHFEDFVQQLSAANLLYQVVQRFAATDLSPERISNFGMGIIFEELIRKFAEAAERQGKVQLIDGSQHFGKMRKSLGSKRQYITDEQIDELVRLYGRFEETAQSKIFPVEAFGYRRITVERPLRLNFQTSAERIEKVLEEKAIEKLEAPARQRLIEALQAMDANVLHRNREQFSKLLKKTLSAHDVSPSTPELKAILNALSERDPEADICLVKGKPEADAGLRDNENVPLGESVYDYFEREVKPHVPDAWIDESKTDAQDGEVGVVGFEIPFNRHFYVFQPPRPLADIDRDLKACTDRIKQMIEGLSA